MAVINLNSETEKSELVFTRRKVQFIFLGDLILLIFLLSFAVSLICMDSRELFSEAVDSAYANSIGYVLLIALCVLIAFKCVRLFNLRTEIFEDSNILDRIELSEESSGLRYFVSLAKDKELRKKMNSFEKALRNRDLLSKDDPAIDLVIDSKREEIENFANSIVEETSEYLRTRETRDSYHERKISETLSEKYSG